MYNCILLGLRLKAIHKWLPPILIGFSHATPISLGLYWGLYSQRSAYPQFKSRHLKCSTFCSAYYSDVTGAMRRLYSVGSGGPVNFGRRRHAAGSNASAMTRSAQLSNVAYLFQNVFRKEDVDVQQYFFRENSYCENTCSIAKGCEAMQADVQFPSSLTCTCTKSS